MEEKKWCVYLHTNKVNGKKYVGITSQKVNRRWRKNGYGYRQPHQHKFYNAILKYGWDNFDHEILEKQLTMKEAQEKEIIYINKFDSYKNGYNATTGGEGSNGYKFTKEDKEKISKKLKGRKFTKEHRENLSKSLKGKAKSKEHLEKIRNSKNRTPKKAVNRYTKDNEYIDTFESIYSASKTLNIGKKEISMCCRNAKSHNTAGGYIWRFA